MIATPADDVRDAARSWRQTLATGEVIDGQSTVGGGSLPGETLPTSLLAIDVDHPQAFLRELRNQDPPIIARIDTDRVVLDPRTVLPEQQHSLLEGLQSALSRAVT